jgi:DNA-binding transcriptional MerR regulator
MRTGASFRPPGAATLPTSRRAGILPRVSADPLLTLREYRQLAPWNLRDLAATSAAILERSRVRPVSATAAAAPTERTIRFYVTRGLLHPPEGRGPSATYSYRHLLQLLSIKLRQMEGAALSQIARELQDSTGDVLERRIAVTLGDRLPAPADLGVADAGRAFHASNAADQAPAGDAWRRITVDAGVEVLVRAVHPLGRVASSELAAAFRTVVDRLGARRRPPA